MIIANFSFIVGVAGRSLAQLAFLSQAMAGAMLLLAISLISLWAALAAVLGMIVNNSLSFVLTRKWGSKSQVFYKDEEWRLGLAGFNGAIIGIFWASSITTASGLLSFVIALILCLVLEYALRYLLLAKQLPSLSLPALGSLYIMMALSKLTPLTMPTISGAPLINDASLSLQNTWLIAFVLILATLARYQPIATLQTIIISLGGALLAQRLTGLDLLALVDLWAFNLATTSFALLAVFLTHSRFSLASATVSALVAGLLWWLWLISGLEQLAPVLLLPFIASTLLALSLIAHIGQYWLFQGEFWRLAKQLFLCRRLGRPPALLIGSGINQTGSHTIYDYPSGQWLAPSVPLSSYTLEAFRTCQRSRYLYWQASYQLYQQVLGAQPSHLHKKIKDLSNKKQISGLIVETIDGFFNDAPSSKNDGPQNIVACYGCIRTLYCLNCGQQQKWPPIRLWQQRDLYCPQCTGLLKPNVIAADEAIADDAQQAITKIISQSGCVLIAGVPALSPVIADILSQAQKRNSPLFFISSVPLGYIASKKEGLIRGELEGKLSTICKLIRLLQLNKKQQNDTVTQGANNKVKNEVRDE